MKLMINNETSDNTQDVKSVLRCLHYPLPPTPLPDVFQKKCRFSLLRSVIEDKRKDIYSEFTPAFFRCFENLLRNKILTPNGAGIYSNISFINHSCDNANTKLKFGRGDCHVIAAKNINVGEEITRNYIHKNKFRGIPTIQRRTLLK
eukprot:UN31571